MVSCDDVNVLEMRIERLEKENERLRAEVERLKAAYIDAREIARAALEGK